ncbi:MAG: MFS transporter [Spirochaetota bacterium]
MSMLKGFATLFFGTNKDYPPALSTQSREYGRKLVWRFFILNGISVAFLMDNILVLYAIRNGMPDPLVAVLSSFVHLTMPFMIIGKYSIARIGAARNWGLGWFLRYLSAAFLITAPLISPHVSSSVVYAIILISGFGFALFRSMGIVSSSPLGGEVTTPENRGDFLSGNHLRVNTSQVLAMLLLISVTSLTDDLWVYQVVIGIACAIGIYASTVLARIPESEVPKQSARIPLAKAFHTLWSNKRSRKLLFAWSGGLTAYMLVIPFMMISVKNGYGISDYAAISFALILLVGGIVSSAVNGMIADQVGPRPIVLMNIAGFLIPATLWATAPSEFMPLLVALTFFLAGYCKIGIMIGLSHYFLLAIPNSDRVGSSLIIRVTAGAVAGLSGTVLGGGLLSWFESSGFAGMEVYRMFFRVIVFVLVILTFRVYRLEKLNEWTIKDILKLLKSPRDMYAIHVLKHLRRKEDSGEDARTLQRLGAIGSSIPEVELREQLNSPLLSVRVNALQALGRISFGKETEEAILNQLACGEHTSGWIAAEIVGKHNILRGVELLRKGLYSSDHFLQGKCMVALVRLQDKEYYPAIISLFEESENPRIIIHGATALSMMGGQEHLSRILKKTLQPELPSSVVDEVLTAAAATVGIRQKFYQFLQKLNQNKEEGASEFISDLDQTAFNPQEQEVLRRAFEDESQFASSVEILGEKAGHIPRETGNQLKELFGETNQSLFRLKTVCCAAMIISEVWQNHSHMGSIIDRTL